MHSQDKVGSAPARQILLHLGMNKTGSTALQVALRGYQTADWAMLDIPGFTQTQAMCLAFRTKVPPQLYACRDAAGRAAERAEARAALGRALAEEHRSVIISSEFLSDFTGEGEVEATLAALRRHAGQIIAIVYLRDPAGYAASLYQQSLKTRLPAADLRGLYPRYRRRLRPWVKALGRRGVIFLPYSPEMYPGDALMRDFAAHGGIDPTAMNPLPRRANASLSAEATALLYCYRKAYPHIQGDPAWRRAEAKMVFRLKGFGERSFSFAPSAVAQLTKGHEADLDWAEARLGSPFPPPSETDRALCLDSPAQFAALAQQVFPAFRDWLAHSDPGTARALLNPAQTLRALVEAAHDNSDD
jgi:hypothetical protein